MYHLLPTQVIITSIGWYARCRNKLRHVRDQITCEICLEGDQAREELMTHLFSTNLCQSLIRMNSIVFLGLCDILVKKGGLWPNLHVFVEE